MCTHKLHLSDNDRRFLRSIRVEAWDCPACTPFNKPQFKEVPVKERKARDGGESRPE